MQTKFNLSVLTFLLIAASCQCFADLMLFDIRSPKHCPDGLTIKSKVSDGMIEFDVAVDAEQIAQADELYKGRIQANAFLKIATAEQQIAFVNLRETTEGKRTRYHFRISRAAAKTSELQLGVSLYEKDGTPTIGGGVSMQIHLAGFQPKTDEK